MKPICDICGWPLLQLTRGLSLLPVAGGRVLSWRCLMAYGCEVLVLADPDARRWTVRCFEWRRWQSGSVPARRVTTSTAHTVASVAGSAVPDGRARSPCRARALEASTTLGAQHPQRARYTLYAEAGSLLPSLAT